MNLFNFLICAIVTACAASAGCSCSSSGKKQPVDSQVSQPSPSPRPIIANNKSKSDATDHVGAAYLSNDLKIVTVEINEKNERLHFEIEINYPQIDSPRTSQQRMFNRYVRKLIEIDVKSFKAFCSKYRKYPDGSDRLVDYHMGARYETLYATPELVSINLTIETFTGYLNSDYSPLPLNFDLNSGQPLKNLSDLFRPRSNFLETVATYCRIELVKRGLNCGSGITNEEQLRTGTVPKAANYSAWNLTRGGVQINFGEYQVGPGCLGLISVVVPYDQLRKLLRQDVDWFRRPSM